MKSFEERIVTNILDLGAKFDLNYSFAYEVAISSPCWDNKSMTEVLIEANFTEEKRNLHEKVFNVDNNTHYNTDMNIFDYRKKVLENHILNLHEGMFHFFMAFGIRGISKNLIINFRDVIIREDYVAAIIMKDEIIKYWTLSEKKYLEEIEFRAEHLMKIISLKENHFVEFSDLTSVLMEQVKSGELEKVQKTTNLLMSEIINKDYSDLLNKEESNQMGHTLEYTLTVLKFGLDFYLR